MAKKIFLLFLITFLLMSPFFSLAQPPDPFGKPPPRPFKQIVEDVINIILDIIWIIAGAFATIMFVLAGFKFLTAQGDPGKVAEAKMAVIWGIIGATVIVLSWSVVTIIKNMIGI